MPSHDEALAFLLKKLENSRKEMRTAEEEMDRSDVLMKVASNKTREAKEHRERAKGCMKAAASDFKTVEEQLAEGSEHYGFDPWSIITRCSQLNLLSRKIADWRERKGFQTGMKNLPEKLLLGVTELSEATEALRKVDRSTYSCMVRDNILPSEVAEELVDCMVRLLDILGSFEVDVEGMLRKVMSANEKREYKHDKAF